MFKFSKSKSFSLIEISVVLVIIGLLITGSLSFSVMIDKAKTQSLVNELTEINKGILNFKNIYGDYPGMLSNDECDKYEEFRPQMLTAGVPNSISSTGASVVGTNATYASRFRCGNMITSAGVKSPHNPHYPLSASTDDWVETIRACYSMRMLVWSGLVSLTSNNTDSGGVCKYDATVKDFLDSNKTFASKKFPAASYLIMPISSETAGLHKEITIDVARKSLYPSGTYAVFLINRVSTVGAVSSDITEAVTVKLSGGSVSAYKNAMTGIKYNATAVSHLDGSATPAVNACNNGVITTGANGYEGQPEVKYLKNSTCNILYKVQE